VGALGVCGWELSPHALIHPGVNAPLSTAPTKDFPMNRRDFSLQLAGTTLGGLAWTGGVSAQGAQGGPVEGTHYIKLSTPATLTLPSPDKKVEVIEFFGYWCPHCNAFESTLEAWVKKLPADVIFRRVPVAFAPPQLPLQKAFYALEEMGQLPAMHRKVFAAIHQQGKKLFSDAEVIEFIGANGVDAAKFREAYSSFGINTRINRARQLSAEYKIDSVPTLGVQGRFYSSAGLAGTNERMLSVVDALVQKVRQGA
jgi:protein dithiol oxidoreductase (disulfide-forming)